MPLDEILRGLAAVVSQWPAEPIVCCLGAVDHDGADVARMALPYNTDLCAEYRPELLGGVTVVTGEALAGGQQPTALTAVPYHAWCNRERAR